MGAGNADGIFVGLHDHAPGGGPLKNGDTQPPGGGDLRVVVVGGGSADDAVGPLNVGGAVADVDMDALGLQLLRGNGGVHVGARDVQAHPLQHQAQGTHGNAADAHQMDVVARGEIAL